MKGIAIILSACLLLLNLENLRETVLSHGNASEMACCADGQPCCCSPDMDPPHTKEHCDGEFDSLPCCTCSCQFQITAISHNSMELSGVVVRSFHYGHHLESYFFEYADDFLQPPRFG
jgi:hypothetical protein